MKLYTLDYDCNRPVTQQVNVATNTDAKIGIKVQKNGEYLELDGSTLSVKIGNEIVFDPITLDGTSVELTGTTTNTPVTLSTDVAGSDYYSYNVAAKKIKVQISYDGTTWEDASPLTSDIVGYWYDLTVDSRRPKALINMADPQIFNVIFGPDSGKHLTELAWTENTRIQMNAKTANWDITSYPCHFRICADFQKPNYQEMLSADAELTNGYVTFPIETNDNASYEQLFVGVDKQANPTAYTGTKQIPIPAFVTNYTLNLLASTLSASVGQKVYAEDIELFYANNASALSGTEISGYNGDSYLVQVIDNNSKVLYGACHATSAGIEKKWRKNTTPDLFFPTYGEAEDYITLEQGWNIRLIVSNKNNTLPTRTGSDTYAGIKIVAKTDPVKGAFKLNVNTFKSQLGDKDFIGELPDIPTKTANLSGTYADNTEFSFDIFYK